MYVCMYVNKATLSKIVMYFQRFRLPNFGNENPNSPRSPRRQRLQASLRQ